MPTKSMFGISPTLVSGAQQLQIGQSNIVAQKHAWYSPSQAFTKKANPLADEANWDTGGRKSPSWVDDPNMMMWIAGGVLLIALVAGGGLAARKRK